MMYYDFLNNIIYGRHQETDECRFSRILNGYFNASIEFRKIFLEFLGIECSKASIKNFSIEPEIEKFDLTIKRNNIDYALCESKLNDTLTIRQVNEYSRSAKIKRINKLFCVLKYDDKKSKNLTSYGFKCKVELKNWASLLHKLILWSQKAHNLNNKIDHFLIDNLIHYMKETLGINYIENISQSNLNKIQDFVKILELGDSLNGTSIKLDNNPYRNISEVISFTAQIVRYLLSIDELKNSLSIRSTSNILNDLGVEKNEDKENVFALRIYYYSTFKNYKVDRKSLAFGFTFYGSETWFYTGLYDDKKKQFYKINNKFLEKDYPVKKELDFKYISELAKSDWIKYLKAYNK